MSLSQAYVGIVLIILGIENVWSINIDALVVKCSWYTKHIMLTRTIGA